MSFFLDHSRLPNTSFWGRSGRVEEKGTRRRSRTFWDLQLISLTIKDFYRRHTKDQSNEKDLEGREDGGGQSRPQVHTRGTEAHLETSSELITRHHAHGVEPKTSTQSCRLCRRRTGRSYGLPSGLVWDAPLVCLFGDTSPRGPSTDSSDTH